MQALIHAKIITPLEEIENGTLLIRDRKIQAIGQEHEVFIPKKAEIFDAGGKIVCPGFIDIHLHGARGYDFAEATKEAIQEIIGFHLAHGTTSFLPTLISLPDQELARVLEELPKAWSETDYASSFLGIHLEGPFLNPACKGVHNAHYLCSPSIEKAESFLIASAGAVRMITLAPELPHSLEIIQYLSQRKVIVSLGHSNATYRQVELAVRQGLVHVTHTFNAMAGLHHREPGAVGAALDINELSADIIADTKHVHPAALRLLWRQKGEDMVILITDASPVAGLPSGTYPLWGRDVRLDSDSVITTDSAQLAGSATTMDNSLRRFQAATGCTYKQAIQLATYNPAALLGIDRQKGLLAKGSDADLVVMDEDFRIEAVIVCGKFLKRRQV
ncbi:MAG: N-acetylglucosamine-6-phosphate deacetylase [bacterium]